MHKYALNDLLVIENPNAAQHRGKCCVVIACGYDYQGNPIYDVERVDGEHHTGGVPESWLFPVLTNPCYFAVIEPDEPTYVEKPHGMD